MLRSRMLAAAQRRAGRGIYGGNYYPQGGAYFGGYYKLGKNNVVYQKKNTIIDAMSPEEIDYTYDNNYLHDTGDVWGRWPGSVGRMDVGQRTPRQIAWTKAVQEAMNALGWRKGAMPPGAWTFYRPRVMAMAREALGIVKSEKSPNWARNPNYKKAAKERRFMPSYVSGWAPKQV